MGSEFVFNAGATADVIRAAEDAVGWRFPDEYKAFLNHSNGGEGFIGDRYLVLWAAEELEPFNRDYQVQEYVPGLLVFGSDGGGEGFGFDTRTNGSAVLQIPFIGMEWRYALPVGANFVDWLGLR